MNGDPGSAPKADLPSLRGSWPVFFRAALGLVSVALVVQNRKAFADGVDVFWYAFIVLVIWLPAVGMLFSWRWAIFEAIVQDCTLGAFALGFSAGSFGGPHGVPHEWITYVALMVVSLISVAECVYLLGNQRASGMSILSHLVVAAVFVCFGWMLGVPFTASD